MMKGQRFVLEEKRKTPNNEPFVLGINTGGSPNHLLSVIHPQRTFLQGLTAGLSVEEKD